jgi:hypothetical protein
MDGQPVWLASMSYRNKSGQFINTAKWKDSMRILNKRQKPSAVLQDIIGPLGDESKERCFRMNMTMCLHRAATDEEVKSLPKTWQQQLPGLAGGPIEILWSTVPISDSARPCHAPTPLVAIKNRPDLFIPQDCHQCLPCKARLALCANVVS